VGPQGSERWTGGTLFWSFVARSPETFASGLAILRTPKFQWSEGPLKGQPHQCVGVSTNRDSGIGGMTCSTSRVPKS
jgi:hypothetical protein